MKSAGNGEPKTCVENLLSMVRGENPMERLKGLDTKFIDLKEDEAIVGTKEDARWLIKTYEPRVNIEDFEVDFIRNSDGEYGITAIIKDV